jgi:polyribonucleotide nucleotidyltransferase
MVEGGSNVVSEAEMLEAVYFGHAAMQPVIDLQIKLRETIGKPKRVIETVEKDQALIDKLEAEAADRIRETVLIPGKMDRYAALRTLKAEIFESLGGEYAERQAEVYGILGDIQKTVCRNLVLKEGRRIDGRKFDEVRPITCEAGLLPRPHGSTFHKGRNSGSGCSDHRFRPG